MVSRLGSWRIIVLKKINQHPDRGRNIISCTFFDIIVLLFVLQ